MCEGCWAERQEQCLTPGLGLSSFSLDRDVLCESQNFPINCTIWALFLFKAKSGSEMVSYDGLLSNCCLFNQPKPQLWGHKRIICFLYFFSVLIRSQSALQHIPNSHSPQQSHSKPPKRPVTHTELHNLPKSPRRLPGSPYTHPARSPTHHTLPCRARTACTSTRIGITDTRAHTDPPTL